MHDVSLLKKYVPSPGNILDLDDNELVNQEEFGMELEKIPKTKEKQSGPFGCGRVTQLRTLLGKSGIT